jgi:hypothetical protein
MNIEYLILLNHHDGGLRWKGKNRGDEVIPDIIHTNMKMSL